MQSTALVDVAMIEKALVSAGRSGRLGEVLEVGCGDGRLTEILADKVVTLTAVDPDESSIAAARRRCASQKSVTFYCCSGERLECGEDTFDRIIFSYSLHHQNGAKALDEAMGVLRPGGDVVILEPAVESEYTRLVAFFEPDEVERLARTRVLIESGKIEILWRELYRVEHPFDSFEVLYRRLVEDFGAHRNVDLQDEVKALIGERASGGPLVITDDVQIFLCRPPTSP